MDYAKIAISINTIKKEDRMLIMNSYNYHQTNEIEKKYYLIILFIQKL